MAIPDSYLDQLVARCDIVDTVSRYVSLKKSGSNYFGVCPFHNEKTPSFSVSSDKQIFHCFGCGEGGGVIQFTMKIENLPFVDAVKLLSDRCGMQMPEESEQNDELRRSRQRMLDMNKEAAKHFNANLYEPCGEQALKYIVNRRLSKKTITAFGVGYAENSWDRLINLLVAKGYTKQEIEQGGLAVRGAKGGMYDRFRNRVMFPIIDIRGNVVAFGGRVLDDSTPKYLNSPETLVFQKNRNLFALNISKKTKQGNLILAEGYMDVIALHQAGFDNAVASLGTSLTPEQAKLISRHSPEVVICYDSDGAGQKAAQRAIDILNKTGLSVRVLKLPGSKDPDDYIKANGPEAFRMLLNKPQTDSEYRLNQIKDKYDLKDDSQRIDFLKEAAFMLAKVQNTVEREIYGRNAAKEAGVSETAFMSEVKRAQTALWKQEKRDVNKTALNPTAQAQPEVRAMAYGNVRSAVCEEKLLTLVMSDGALLDIAAKEITPQEFSSVFLGNIYEHALNRKKQGLEPLLAACIAGLSEDEVKHVTKVMTDSIRSQDSEKELSDYISQIKHEYSKNRDGGDDFLRQAADRRRHNM